MSLLPNKSHLKPDQPLYLPYFAAGMLNASTLSTQAIETSSLLANTISCISLDAEYMNASTMNTLHLDLDGQILTASPTDLLLNGVPIATTGNLSSIADWSYEPAISTVQMAGNNLNQAGNISTTSIVGGTAFFTNLMALNSMFLSTYTSTISSMIETAEEGYFSTLSTGLLTGGNVVLSQFLSTPQIYVSSINGAEFTSTTLTVQVAGVSSLFANSISSLGAELRTALVSTLQFNPSFNPSLDVNLGLGSLFGNLAGAATGAIGVLVGGAALGTGIAALTQARQTRTIGTSTFELVNGTTQLQVSTIGDTVSSIIRYVSSSDPTAVPGEEYFTSTIIPAGTVCIRSVSDPLNTVSSPNSTIQYFGQWVSLNEVLLPPSTVSTFADVYTSSLQASTLQFTNGTQFRTGAPFAGTGFLSTTELFWNESSPPLDADLRVGGLVITGSDVGGINTSKDVLIQNANSGNRLLVYPGGSTIAYLEDTPPVVSTFQTLAASSLFVSTATVQGQVIINPSTLRSGIYMPFDATNGTGVVAVGISTSASIYEAYSFLAGGVGDPIGVPAQQEMMTLLETTDNEVSFQFADVIMGRALIQGNINYGSYPSAYLDGDAAGNLYLNALGVTVNSTLTAASTFAAPVASVSTIQIPGLSTIQISTSSAAGTAAQPAGRLVISGNDLDLGQQDLWAQQVRVGAGNPGGSAQTEVIWYSPDGLTQRGIGLGGSDLTLRLQSTINSGTNNGYILDTTINRPIFSTINGGTSTALMAVFPSTNLGVFGTSTLSILPSLNIAGTFLSRSTQTVAANTPLPLWHEVTGPGVGGLTTSTTAIVVPSAGLYEIQTSIQFDKSGASPAAADFWFRQNGTDIPDSASEIVVAGSSGEVLGNVSLVCQLAANDKIEVVMASSNNTIAATFFQSTITTPYTRPAIPSVITNVKRIG